MRHRLHRSRRTLPAHPPPTRKEKAVTVGRSILVIVWFVLRDDNARFADFGADYYDSRINPELKKRNQIHELEALG